MTWVLVAVLCVSITGIAYATRTIARMRSRSRALPAAHKRAPRMRTGAGVQTSGHRRESGEHDDPTTGAGDDETVMMGDKTRSRLSQTHIDALLHKAHAASFAGDFREAAALYTDLLDGCPGHITAHLERGRAYLDLGDYNRAMSDFVMAEDLDPKSPLAQIATGDLHFARKEYARAISCYDGALALDLEHALAWCRRGISHGFRDNHEQALEDLLRAKKLDPDIPNLETYLTTARSKAERARKKRR